MNSTEVHKTFFWFPSLSIFLYIVGNRSILLETEVTEELLQLFVSAKSIQTSDFPKKHFWCFISGLAQKGLFKKVLGIVSVITVTDFLFPLFNLFTQRWAYYSEHDKCFWDELCENKKRRLEITCKQIVAQMETWFYSKYVKWKCFPLWVFKSFAQFL